MNDVRLEWRVKDFLLAYMRSEPDFTVTENGARFDEECGIVLPAVADAAGDIRATGDVVIAAHGGSLAVSLTNVTLQSGALWIDDPFADSGSGRRRRLVTLERLRDEPGDDNVDVWQTRLAPEASPMFSFRYTPGSIFANLRVTTL